MGGIGLFFAVNLSMLSGACAMAYKPKTTWRGAFSLVTTYNTTTSGRKGWLVVPHHACMWMIMLCLVFYLWYHDHSMPCHPRFFFFFFHAIHPMTCHHAWLTITFPSIHDPKPHSQESEPQDHESSQPTPISPSTKGEGMKSKGVEGLDNNIIN